MRKGRIAPSGHRMVLLLRRRESENPSGTHLPRCNVRHQFHERILISIVVRDKNAEKDRASHHQVPHRPEKSATGRIFIIPIEDAIRIRTAERGDIALYNAEQER